MLNALQSFDLSVQEVAVRLHSMVEKVLFGTNPWPPEPIVVNAALDKLGVEVSHILWEPIPSVPLVYSCTDQPAGR
jgi:hypothetical protein